MSVRIHQLSKQIGIENKELIELLRSRGFEVKSSSSTIDNISAESLVEEFAKKNPVEEPKEKEAEPIEAVKEAPKKTGLPEGAIIKSTEELNTEKAKKESAQTSARVSPASPPKMPPPIKRPNTPIAIPVPPKVKSAEVKQAEEGASADGASEGSEKIIHAKPPIVVRDFALQLELKPFKLISELMELGTVSYTHLTLPTILLV